MFPQMFLIAPQVLCPKWSSFHLYRWTKGDSLHLPKEISFCGAFKVFFWLGNGPIKMAHCTEKKVQLVRQPNLLNIRMNNKCPRMESSCGGRFYGDSGLRGRCP